MSQILFTAELAEYIRSLIWTNLQATLSLKVVQIGDISFFDTPENLLTLSPGVFIRPSGGVDVEMRTTNFKYLVKYRFRVVFVFDYAQADAVVANKMAKITTLADLFFDNTRLAGISTISNGVIIHAIPTSIEYDPPEDGFLAAIGSQLVAGAINLEILIGTSTT